MVFPQGSDTLQNEYIEDGIEVANDSLCEESDTLDNEYVEDSIEASEYSFEDEDTPEDQDTPEDRDTHKDLDEENVKDIVDLPVNGMKVGVSFPSEQSALASLRKWMDLKHFWKILLNMIFKSRKNVPPIHLKHLKQSKI